MADIIIGRVAEQEIFNKATLHRQIIEALARKAMGMTRTGLTAGTRPSTSAR